MSHVQVWRCNPGNDDHEPVRLPKSPIFTVCIIDDEAPICDILRRLFQRVGWAATCLTDSTIAYRTLRAAPVDAVLLDLMMPGVDGFGVLAAIRSDPVLAKTPVIFYSAVSDEAVK